MTGCRHIRDIGPDCGCFDDEEIDPSWEPNERHALAVDQVRQLVAKWEPRLPWLSGWKLKVRPIPEGHGEWSMRIDTALYVKIATLEVRESVLEPDDILDDEHSVELMVLHELCHILFEQGRYVFMNWLVVEEEIPQPALLAMQDAEETSVWSLARALLAMERDLNAATRDTLVYQNMSSRLSEHVVKATRAKKGREKERSA